MPHYDTPEAWWYSLLMGDDPEFPWRKFRRVLGLIPSQPRCRFCNVPYHGPLRRVFHLLGKHPSKLTPQLCKQCYDQASQHIGGAEVELTMLFADVRGSTTLAESMSPAEFGRLINRFFAMAGEVLVKTEGWADRLIGDQVVGIFVPGSAGAQHTDRAIEAAQELLRRTGHGEPGGPWLPVGAGVHRGIAYVGAVGTAGGATDVTVLGDAANITARLSSNAAAGEILISDAAYAAASLDLGALERRELALKGKSERVGVRVLRSHLI